MEDLQPWFLPIPHLSDGRMDRRTDGWTDGRTDERTNERTDGRTDGLTDNQDESPSIHLSTVAECIGVGFSNSVFGN
jgi:hypothetical protein